MTEASHLWYERVDKAVEDLNRVLEDHRRFLLEQATARTELRLALLKAHTANRSVITAPVGNRKALKTPLRAAAAAALVVGSASYAQA